MDMRYVYIDEVLILNFAMDLALVILTSRICAVAYSMRRALLSSAVGALWALAVSLCPALSHPLFSLFSAAGMAVIAFGLRDITARALLVFLALSAAFAGLGSISGGSLAVFIPSFLCAYFVYSLVFRAFLHNKVSGSEYSYTVRRGGRTASFTALADTGNTLRDPLRGVPVTICSLDAVRGLLDREEAAILSSFGAIDAVERLRGFSLIPYKSVGKDGFLPAFMPESVSVNGKSIRCVIAVDPDCTLAAVSPVQEV